MKIEFKIDANLRQSKGKGASRRLRKEDLVPGIVYGLNADPVSIQVSHRELMRLLENDSVYTSIIKMNLDGKIETVVLRDLHRHVYKPRIMHFDFQRIDENKTIEMKVPLHFTGEELAPGVKIDGGIISRLLSDVVVNCLPKDLPEFINVDLSKMALNQVIKLSDLILPEGVQLLNLLHGKDSTVVTLYAIKEKTNNDSVTTDKDN